MNKRERERDDGQRQHVHSTGDFGFPYTYYWSAAGRIVLLCLVFTQHCSAAALNGSTLGVYVIITEELSQAHIADESCIPYLTDAGHLAAHWQTN